MNKALAHNHGFTIIEAVVSVSVFAITVTGIIGVYLSVQKLNGESMALQAVQQNLRFISEDVAKLVRNGAVDYPSYTNGHVPQPYATELYMTDQDSQQVRIYLQNNSLYIDKAGNTAPLTGRDVIVRNFRVYIVPDANPFTNGVPPASQYQPAVTMVLEMESNLNVRDRIVVPFQITASTKQYPIVN